MACKQYHSDQGVDAPIPEPGESATGTRNIAARVRATSSGDVPARHSTVLPLTAAGMRCSAAPLQFMESIDVANRQLGNRAFMRWIGSIHAAGLEKGTREMAAGGAREQGPLLQFGPKKHKKKKEPVAPATPGPPAGAAPKTGSADVAGAAQDTPSETGTTTGPEAAVTETRDEAQQTATGEVKKKKKKSRVQVALNTLREEGGEAFRSYLEARIGETELLHTLTERIMQAQDLGGVRDAALGVVRDRIRYLDPEGDLVMPQAAAAGKWEVPETAVIAPIERLPSAREVALRNCCYRGEARKLENLLRFGSPDINMGFINGTPLYVAAAMDRPAVVRILLSRPDIDVNLAHPTGATPLFVAAQMGHLEVARLLLEKQKTNPLLATPVNRTTPLTAAAYNGHMELVQLLLSSGRVDINTRQKDGATALFAAVQADRPLVTELLIREGADVNLPLDDRTTPLCLAVYNGNIDLVKLLLQAPGIQINQAGLENTSPLYYAADRGHEEIVELLLNNEADPNIPDASGMVALQVACLNGYERVVELLLDKGADTEVAVLDNYTPYRLAGIGGHHAIISLLEARSRRPAGQAVQSASLPPRLRPQGQVPEDRPEQAASTAITSAISPQSGEMPAQPKQDAVSMTGITRDAGVEGDTATANRVQTEAGTGDPTQAAPGDQAGVTQAQALLAQAKQEFRQDILMRLVNERISPLKGIRLMEDANAADSMDTLCSLYNRLASIERKQARAPGRSLRRHFPAERTQAAPGYTGPVMFALGDRKKLDAAAVEEAIKEHLAQTYHRFVSQTVNDMEFGRGKPTSGYPGLWHSSAGIPGVGSCSVFYYVDEEQRQVRIAGIGHHLDSETYRLDYAVRDLGGSGRILRLS